ncbi:uncharacterized protein F5147DRAFT_170892 [Suillus discolor]|uniref:Uncharacterized protein n=1 Tax=Suillus discolor TaxID=1912936 RepID=A0A9P7F658_9AGAM|nr:uncharacterized protein F5147DRAFT_170892 [Suillus discolor]KAG2108429.1 hypothetical protein F5147DRAFT_170892 [Suillus discolor]
MYVYCITQEKPSLQGRIVNSCTVGINLPAVGFLPEPIQQRHHPHFSNPTGPIFQDLHPSPFAYLLDRPIIIPRQAKLEHNMSHTFRSTYYELSEWASGYLYRSVRVPVVSVVIVLECLSAPSRSRYYLLPSSGAPTWETKCMYKHTFRYGSVDSGLSPVATYPLNANLVTLYSLNLARPRERYPFSPSKLYGATT